MGEGQSSTARFLWTVLAVILIVPVVIVGVVAVKTWVPLRHAQESLDRLNTELGPAAIYTPALLGEIPPDRMELFLELRAVVTTACDKYGAVQEGFDAVTALDSTDAGLEDVPNAMSSLGSASLAITPFLAEFFELRNNALLEAKMGLEEYAYIYALAYHDQLLSDQTRAEIFSGGLALSPEASGMLRECLTRQLAAAGLNEADRRSALENELQEMEADPGRLLYQDGLPVEIAAGLRPYRERLDRLFCPATAGLEMDRTSGRAIRLALY